MYRGGELTRCCIKYKKKGRSRYNELSNGEFKKLIRKQQYNYIKKIAKEGFY
jgi:hypothetical protein